MSDASSSAIEGQNLAINKDLIVAMPLLVTAIAATFDVGYFSGIDINYFTLFSLSEHLVFALEALPMALIICAVFVIGILEWDVLTVRHKKEIDPKKRARQLKRQRYLRIIFVVLLGATSLFAYYSQFWEGVVIGLSMLILFIGMMLWPEILRSRRGILAYVSLAILIFSFVYGLNSAQRYLEGKKILHQLILVDGNLDGRIIRSGDLGVLFYDPAGEQISLIRWNRILAVARKRGGRENSN
jgi:general stress protein CsbA